MTAKQHTCTWCEARAVERRTEVPYLGALYACEDHGRTLNTLRQGKHERLDTQPSLFGEVDA